MIVACFFAALLFNFVLFSARAQNAFSSDINSCLFNHWGTAVISAQMQCTGPIRKGLCYGLDTKTALFAVCYNTETLIPEYTGHVVQDTDKRAAGRAKWRNEAGSHAPSTQSEQSQDYKQDSQRELLGPHYNDKTGFFSRGHLTPNNAFDDDDSRRLTMINTNIAPQWQQFNSQNWATVERAVKEYARGRKNRVYVVTGTGGDIQTTINGRQVAMKLNGRVQVPRYFWKAVCDPKIGESVVFVARNPSGGEATQRERGCNGNEMTPTNGIVHCYSLQALQSTQEASLFQLPPFAAACNPAERGRFLDNFLKHLN